MENFERDALETDLLNKIRKHRVDLVEAGESEMPATITATDDGITENLESSPVSGEERKTYFEEGDIETPATFNRKNRLKFGK